MEDTSKTGMTQGLGRKKEKKKSYLRSKYCNFA